MVKEIQDNVSEQNRQLQNNVREWNRQLGIGTLSEDRRALERKLFELWICLRCCLCAALQTNVVWVIGRTTGNPVDWMQIFWILSCVHIVRNLRTMYRSSVLSIVLPIDVLLYGFALWYGLLAGSVLAGLLGVGIWLWTHAGPDWFLVCLGSISAMVIFFRQWGKMRQIRRLLSREFVLLKLWMRPKFPTTKS